MKYFKMWEFDCHCRRADCDAAPMQEEFLIKLDALREDWGSPLKPTSARRCNYQNEKVNGAPGSYHLLGNATDFVFETPAKARVFASLAEKHGFMGIGLGQHLVHIDNRKTNARWFYHL